ncbi:hypothetical protein CPS_3368 [Colwellia psychrerythraea 34H]|uniref:Uncharacterized protein n=1 Tax=Colwellia psychrerythraea (strain 34H / ATCC BAA-681) TaxID=167879 RepID=Q47YS6_COLP3|nr:hypothetical protein CPS_3368 [Colwellia psychrerythraea 34H]
MLFERYVSIVSPAVRLTSHLSTGQRMTIETFTINLT